MWWWWQWRPQLEWAVKRVQTVRYSRMISLLKSASFLWCVPTAIPPLCTLAELQVLVCARGLGDWYKHMPHWAAVFTVFLTSPGHFLKSHLLSDFGIRSCNTSAGSRYPCPDSQTSNTLDLKLTFSDSWSKQAGAFIYLFLIEQWMYRSE